MRIVFWQNCLSPHQLPYIIHLLEDARVNKVVIVAEETINKSRKDMGWDIASLPGLDKCDVYVSPSPQQVEQLLCTNPENSYHLFSGIRGFHFVFQAFQCSLKYNLKRGLITERPNTFAFGHANGKPLWLHRIRFLIQDRKYAPHIQAVFAMGNDAVKYFHSVWKQWDIFPFSYCTYNEDFTNSLPTTTHPSSNIDFIYVGSLSWRKAVLDILKAQNRICKHNKANNCQISYIGDGAERNKLEAYIKTKTLTNIKLLGKKKNSEIPDILAIHDILILPSIYDGWGAVVNEALSKGLYVICSDKCGAKELLNDERCGKVFRTRDYKQLATIMQYCIENITEIRKNKQFRQRWAQECISGKIIAKYLIDCLTGEKTERPWFRKSSI